MKKAIIVISVVLLIAGGATYYFFSINKYKEPIWKIAKIEAGSVSVNITATGSLNAVTTVQVGAQVSGIVAKLFVDFNSEVKKGQIIAQLDTTLLYAIVRDAAAAVAKAKVQVALTKSQFTRIDTLFHAKVVSQNDYDISFGSYSAAKADLQAALATLDHEKTNLKYCTIKAPINGTVISRNVDVGQTVISSFNAVTLFTIANDLRLMQVLADVDEADIGQVKEGQKAIFTVDAFPYEVFKGFIAQVRLQPIIVQNVNNYIVVINVANPDLKLLPGLTATTTIQTDHHDSVLKVIANAIHFNPPAEYLNHIHFPDSLNQKVQTLKVAGNEIPKQGSTLYIWVKRIDVLHPVLVTTGLFDGTFIEISGDIKEGDEVVAGIGATAASTTTPTANNPFMPKMPSRKSTR